MLVITGTGRSGTSVIAKWLDECGLLPYESEWIPQFNSGYYPKDVRRLNSAIWIGNDAPLQSLPLQEEMIKGFDYNVVKDPMFFYGNVLDTWLSVRTDLTFLICIRNFHHVEKSRRKVNQLNQLKNPEELRLCFGTFLSTLIFKGIKYKIVNYPNFLDEHDAIYSHIESLDESVLELNGKKISRKKSLKVWESVVDKSLITS